MLKAFLLAMLLGTASVAEAASARDSAFVPAGFSSDFRTVDGVRLHFVRGGRGPLVLLVHGFGQDWSEWRHLMPQLAGGHTVVAVELPGLGLSAPPKSYAGQDVAALLHRFAKSLSPAEKFDLVAHDIGIWNTYPMVVGHQADLSHVVMMEAPIPDRVIYQLPAFTPGGEALVWHFSFFSAGDHLPETLIRGHELLFFSHFIHEHAARKDAFTPAALQQIAMLYSNPGVLHAAMSYYRALSETERRNEPLLATKLTMPTLAIGGGGTGGLQDLLGSQMKQYATNVETRVLPNCGHWLPEECPAELASLVIEFLAR